MSSTLDPAPASVAPPDFTLARLSDLTKRERDVLELITNGYTNDEAARMLYLSLNTIKTHIRSAYRKIGAESRAQAVVWGVHHGLLAGVPPTSTPD